VDDTFVIWPHGPDKPKDLFLPPEQCPLNHSVHHGDRHLPFLGGSLCRKVYRKPTHTNLYLNSSSHHHPSNKHAILSTLVHKARALCGQDSFHAELAFLGRMATPTSRFVEPSTPPEGCPAQWKARFSCFPAYVGLIFNYISSVLSQHTKAMDLSPRRISSFLQSIKDNLWLKDTSCIQHPVWVLSGVHWADGLLDWHQVEVAPTTYQSRTSGQVSCD
jgi:hypothetical protein